MTKEIMRKCAACSTFQDRSNMIKITSDKTSKEVYINPNSKIFGRSAYLCYNNSCIKEILKKSKLERILKTKISENLKQQLELFIRKDL